MCEFGTKHSTNQNQTLPPEEGVQAGGASRRRVRNLGRDVENRSMRGGKLENFACWESHPGRECVWRSWLTGSQVVGYSWEQQVSLMS